MTQTQAIYNFACQNVACGVYDLEPKLNSSSYLRIRRSTTNGPNGSSAATKMRAPRPMDHFAVHITRARAKQKSRKRRPCTKPAIFTAAGRPAKYLSGIAIATRTRNEIASANAACRRN